MSLADEDDAYACHACGKECREPERLHFGRAEIELSADVCPGGVCRRNVVQALIGNEQIPLAKRQEIASRNPEDALALLGNNAREAIAGEHNHTHTKPEAPLPSDDRDDIGKNLLTRFKQAFTEDKYAVDQATVTTDLLMRIDWYQENMAMNENQIREDGDRILEGAVRKVVELGFTDAQYATQSFEKIWREAIRDQGLSIEAMSHASLPPRPPKKPKWNDAELIQELAFLMRRSLDGRLSAKLNRGRMATDVRNVIQRVIDARGAAGYAFLRIFPVDARKGSVEK